MKTYEQGDSIRVEIDVKARSGRTYVLVNPASGCRLTLYDPDRTAVVDNQAMYNEATGLYYYNWQSASDSKRGVYVARISAIDTSNTGVIEEKLFKIK